MSERIHPQASRYGNAHADLNQQTGRDVRLDLFRGLSLFFIFIDHIPNNVLSYVTLHSIGFSDAAEVFVFISGYAAATVYGKALRRQGSIFATAQIYRRVWQLYIAHIFTFVVFAAGICYAMLKIQNQTFSEDLGMIIFSTNPKSRSSRFCCCSINPSTSTYCRSTCSCWGHFPWCCCCWSAT